MKLVVVATSVTGWVPLTRSFTIVRAKLSLAF